MIMELIILNLIEVQTNDLAPTFFSPSSLANPLPHHSKLYNYRMILVIEFITKNVKIIFMNVKKFICTQNWLYGFVDNI